MSDEAQRLCMCDHERAAVNWEGGRLVWRCVACRLVSDDWSEVLKARRENDELRAEVERLRLQLQIQQANNEKRNRQLDALHLVWCNGGCPGGVHRWTEATVTEELVVEAERNTARLRSWWNNHKARTEET